MEMNDNKCRIIPRSAVKRLAGHKVLPPFFSGDFVAFRFVMRLAC